MSREWLALLIRRMDAVASIYRLAASMSPDIDGLRSHVEFHRRGRFDATITLHDGRSFGVARQGLALRRRSLYDRLRAIAEYDYTRCPCCLTEKCYRNFSTWGPLQPALIPVFHGTPAWVHRSPRRPAF